MIKRKTIQRILLGMGLTLLVLLVAGIAALRTGAFHRYALATMIEKASQATGFRVEIGDFQFHWPGLKVDLYRIVAHGTETESSAPLLQIDHLRVRLKIISLMRHKVNLSEISIDRPKINLFVDRSGGSNWGTARNGATGHETGTSVFDLAVGHFVVNHGQLNCNDRQIPLAAELHDLNTQIDFSSRKAEYRGSLGYRDGRIQFGAFNPVQHSLQVRFGATRAQLTLDSMKLSAGASSISLQGHLKDYRNPTAEGSYQANISTGELGAILKASPFPAGQVGLQGTVQYVNHPGGPFLDNVTLDGKFNSKTLALNLPQGRACIDALRGDYRLSGGTLEARNIHASLLGGAASGRLTLAHLSQQPEAKVEAAVQNISLQAIGGALDSNPLKTANITGTLKGTLDASWQGGGKNLQLNSDATISASAPVQQETGPETYGLPVQGALHLAYDGRSSRMTLTDTQFATPHTTLILDGSAGKQSSLSIRAQSDDLREVDQLALIARNSGSGKGPQNEIRPLGLLGSASFEGQLRGSMSDPHLTGRLSSPNFQYQGTDLTELHANVALSPSEMTLSQGEIQTPDRALVQFTLGAGLSNWAYTPQSPVRVDLTAARVPAATVQRLAKLHYPVSGMLSAYVSMHGTQTELVGQGSATLAQAELWGQPVQNLSVQFHGAGSTVISSLQVQTPAGSGSGTLTYDFQTQGYDAQFTAPALQIEKLAALSRVKVGMTGVVSASLQGRGTVKDPQLAATLQAQKLVIDKQALDGLKLQANMAQQKATATLEAGAQGASIQARANVDLNSNYNATASLDMRNVQLGSLLTAYLPQAPTDWQGHAEVHATLHGPLKQRDQLEAEVNIPTLNLAYQSLQIGNTAPLHAFYRGGIVSLDPCTFKGTGTDLRLQATVPLERNRSMRAQATGDVDVHLLQLLYPDWSTSGQLHLDLNAQGMASQPNLHGTVRVTDAVFQPPGAPMGVQKLNAVFTVNNDRVDIQSFTGESGAGTLTAQGFATLQPSVQFNVRLAAKEVRMRYPVGTRTILDGRLTLTGSREEALLNGRVTIDRLSLTKDFDVATFTDQFIGKAASSGAGFAGNIKLNVSLNTASDMAVASSKLSVQGSANLMVRGTAAEPVILGRTDITDGELFFNGQRYKVESGVVQFVNPVRTQPVVNLHVTTTVNQFDISMNFAGPVDRMRVTYTSDPPLAPVDIINLLATGRTTEAASANPSTPQSVIAGQLTSRFSNRLEKLAGISSLTIDPQVGSGQGNVGARLTVQQRVTKNLFFSISTALQNSADQTAQIEYQATKKFAVSTTRDQNGGYTIQIKMHHRF